jgi:LysR family transcriptional regulator, regulator for metE and metH
MYLEVRHLKLVQAIADEGGVTKAGSRLHLTQSALSHQLKEVEERLGAPLFLRVNKRMVLTPAGERLLASAGHVLAELERTEEDIKRIAASRRGVIRLSTECYTCYHWLPEMMRAFGDKFPEIEVKIEVEATRRPLGALLEGKLDLAVVSSRPRDRRLTLRPLFRDELVVVLSPEHRLASRPFITAEDFAGEVFITHTPAEENSVLQQFLKPAGVAPRHFSQVQLTEAIIEMVKAGLGVSVLARWAAAGAISSGALRALPLTRKGFHRWWGAAMIRTKSPPDYLSEFVDLLAEQSSRLLTGRELQAGRRGRGGRP